jgi:ElaB/YqjD/DUF883 family membrane-anchored ribosome-binding protein
MDETNPGTAQPTNMNQLIQDLKLVVHDAENLVKATAGDMGEKVREARVRLNESLSGAKDQLQKLQQQAAEKAKAADVVIRNHPYESIGAAFGVGLLIGVLVGRR